LPHRHGFSLSPLIADPRDMVMCAWYGQNFLLSQRTVVTDRYKYVFNGFDFDECYDLSNNPDALRNLAADSRYLAVVGALCARRYELLERFDDP